MNTNLKALKRGDFVTCNGLLYEVDFFGETSVFGIGRDGNIYELFYYDEHFACEADAMSDELFA